MTYEFCRASWRRVGNKVLFLVLTLLLSHSVYAPCPYSWGSFLTRRQQKGSTGMVESGAVYTAGSQYGCNSGSVPFTKQGFIVFRVSNLGVGWWLCS